MNFTRKDIAICILFFEKPEQTIDCIKSFLGSETKIYVLNNNSSEDSTNLLLKFTNKYKRVKVFYSNKNLGVSKGRNFLIKNTKEKWLFFVDNDIIIKSNNWLTIVLKIIKHNPQADAIIPKLYNKHEGVYVLHLKTKIKGNNVIFNKAKNIERPNIFPGGASIVNRKIFKEIGLYDERMFVGLEDFELAIRAIKQNKTIQSIIENKILLIHDHRSAKTSDDKKAILERYNIEKIQHSYDILKQTHNLNLDNDWKPWVIEQVKIMTTPISLLDRIKKFFSNGA